MLPRTSLGHVAKPLKNWPPLIPVRKLIRIVTAPRLARLPSRNQHNRLVPIRRIRDEAHRRPVMIGGPARTEGRTRLRLAGDAEKILQQAGSPERMRHVQRIESLPRPILDT